MAGCLPGWQKWYDDVVSMWLHSFDDEMLNLNTVEYKMALDQEFSRIVAPHFSRLLTMEEMNVCSVRLK